MNHSLKSAIIGGGSIGTFVTAFLLVGYILVGLVAGVAEASLFGPAFFVLIAFNVIASLLGLASWLLSIVDASSNVALNEQNRVVWIVLLALFGIWFVPFYWFKYVKR